MDAGILMAGEANETDLAGFLRFQHRLESASGRKDPVRIFHADYFVELHEIDVVGLEALERFINLPGSRGFFTPVDLGHEKHFVAIAVAQPFPHAHFAAAVMIIPAIIHERDAAVDGRAEYSDALGFAGITHV